MGQGVEKKIRSSISHLHQRIIYPSYQTFRQWGLWKGHTTLQSLMNTKLSLLILTLFVFLKGGRKQNAGSLLTPVSETFFMLFHMYPWFCSPW